MMLIIRGDIHIYIYIIIYIYIVLYIYILYYRIIRKLIEGCFHRIIHDWTGTWKNGIVNWIIRG